MKETFNVFLLCGLADSALLWRCTINHILVLNQHRFFSPDCLSFNESNRTRAYFLSLVRSGNGLIELPRYFVLDNLATVAYSSCDVAPRVAAMMLAGASSSSTTARSSSSLSPTDAPSSTTTMTNDLMTPSVSTLTTRNDATDSMSSSSAATATTAADNSSANSVHGDATTTVPLYVVVVVGVVALLLCMATTVIGVMFVRTKRTSDTILLTFPIDHVFTGQIRLRS
jgi:hypothetical protein